MNVAFWLKQAKQQIDGVDAELIALRFFAPKKADRSWLAIHDGEEINEFKQANADLMVAKRANGIPLAYLLREKEFYGRKFVAGPGALIPRPETESLIDLIKTLDLPRQSCFLDVGTGSGCIAITLALEYPQSYVVAVDSSLAALRIAEQNNILHEGRVELVQSDLLDDLGVDDVLEHFDVVVANLPYVNIEWDWVKPENLVFEPASALYAKGNNGLSIYQRFLKEIRYHRQKSDLQLDYLVLEADPCQRQDLVEMARKAGFIHLRTEGYGLLFEDTWRYWWDYEANEYIHKPNDVIEYERSTGEISFVQEDSIKSRE